MTTKEYISQMMSKVSRSRIFESRQEGAKKGWETRRRNIQQQLKHEQSTSKKESKPS